MDRSPIDASMKQRPVGRANRRQVLAGAAALGLSAGAASSLTRLVGAQQGSPVASPIASPVATPIASPVAFGHAMTSITREAYWQAIRQQVSFEPPARQGGVVVIGEIEDIGALNPNLAISGLANVIIGFLFEALVTVNPLDGRPAPGLADYWERSDDGLIYTFHLNRDATWHDGQPVTADDVVFSFRSVLAQDSLGAVQSTVAAYLADVRRLDDHTVALVARDRFATFVENTAMAIAIVPRHIWASVPLAEWGDDPGSTGQNPRRVIGSGPFTFREWVTNDHVTIVKRADHWDPNVQPVIDEVTLRVLGERSAMIQSFEAGEIDVVNVEPQQAESMRQRGSDAVLTEYDTTDFVYFVPMQNPDQTELFLDAPVRQALMYALDRQLLVETVYDGHAIAARGTQPVLSVAYRPEKITTDYTYDPARAQQLLEGAGWEIGNDGIRQRAGERFSFTCHYTEGIALLLQLLTYLQQAWRAVGIEMIPVAVPFATLLEIVDGGTFEMALLGFSWSVDGSQGAMYRCDAVPPAGYNSMRYCNPRYDALDDAQVRELNQARRIELLVEASNLVNDDVANGVLIFRKGIIGAQPRLHNFRPTAHSDYWSLPIVWVDG